MESQPIDEYCRRLNPSTKKALTDAGVSSTLGREACLSAAYPESGKTDRLREHVPAK